MKTLSPPPPPIPLPGGGEREQTAARPPPDAIALPEKGSACPRTPYARPADAVYLGDGRHRSAPHRARPGGDDRRRARGRQRDRGRIGGLPRRPPRGPQG